MTTFKKLIRVKPEPSCPKCGSAPMRLRRPKADAPWKPFWSCKRWPECDGTRQPVTKNEDQPAFWEEQEVVYERV